MLPTLNGSVGDSYKFNNHKMGTETLSLYIYSSVVLNHCWSSLQGGNRMTNCLLKYDKLNGDGTPILGISATKPLTHVYKLGN